MGFGMNAGLRGPREWIQQLAVMSAIVATTFWMPALGVVSLAFWLFGVPPEAFYSFGGALATYLGVLAWWAIGFVPAAIYVAIVMAKIHEPD